MDTLLDDVFNDKPKGQAVYATFWNRAGASLVDILPALCLIPVNLYNETTWKNIPILVFVSVISISYKPFMEYYYGATLGKMARGLVVTNYDFEKPSLDEILTRNIFYIISGCATFFMSLYLFTLPEFGEIKSFLDYQMFVQKHKYIGIFNNAIGLVMIVDALMLFSDKHLRTYHDKLGKTYVVKQDSLRKNSI
jgi:uncharacterized RDD family membrane protein YckC